MGNLKNRATSASLSPSTITNRITRYKLASITTPDRHGDVAGSSPIEASLRKRTSSVAGFDASPGSPDSQEQNGADDGINRKRPVKRACNECRQQKLRCDVVQEPFQTCSRCKRLKLECKIEENFKRVGKRSRNAEMEKEIVELRKQVAAQKSGKTNATPVNPSSVTSQAYTNEAAAGLLDLRENRGSGGNSKRLGDVILKVGQINDIFQRFFKFCHPFLPFLSSEKSPDEYYASSPILFWTIILIGARHYSGDPNLFAGLAPHVQSLIWSTMSEVPQSHQVVKALILLCAWPLPCNSTSTDPTFIMAGMMMQIALQIGLHRPDHAQDFSKFRIELRQADLQDRVVTWSVCNMVAQRIATAYGQPPNTIYDWALGPKPIESNPSYELPPEIYRRLQIERFVDKVSKTIYTNRNDPVGLPDDVTRSGLVKLLSADLKELEDELRIDESEDAAITQIYLKAAALHLHLSAYFSHRNTPSYRIDMFSLHTATIDFLEACLNLESAYSINLPSSYSHGLSLSYGTNYIFHMMLAAGFSLLKLMHHFLPQHDMDIQGASGLLTRTLWALRSASVVENDLPERLSEVLAQVWKSGPRRLTVRTDGRTEEAEDELQLKVKCRMSMSLVFDSVWRWRQNFRNERPPATRFFNGKAATDPSGLGTTSTSNQINKNNTTIGSLPNTNSNLNNVTLAPSVSSSSTTMSIPGMAGMAAGIADDFGPDPYGATDYGVFDPLNWLLDGTVSYPYSFQQGGSGMDQMDSMTAEL